MFCSASRPASDAQFLPVALKSPSERSSDLLCLTKSEVGVKKLRSVRTVEVMVAGGEIYIVALAYSARRLCLGTSPDSNARLNVGR